VKGRLKITVIVPLVLPTGLSERSAEKLRCFSQIFQPSLFILHLRCDKEELKNRIKTRKYNVFSKLSNLYSWDSKFVSTVKTKRKYSWDSNFVSTSKHRRKRRSTSTFSYQLCSRRKEQKFFKHQKGVQRTYVTVANQSTVHGTNPTRKKNTISANRYTDGHTWAEPPSNKSFRTNTFVRRQPQLLYFSNFSAWSENIIGRNQSFSPNQIL
jgi:hypothetical protein